MNEKHDNSGFVTIELSRIEVKRLREGKTLAVGSIRLVCTHIPPVQFQACSDCDRPQICQIILAGTQPCVYQEQGEVHRP